MNDKIVIMTEGVGVQPEEKPQDRVRSEFNDFLKDAKKGTPKYNAANDFLDIERLKHQEHIEFRSIEKLQSKMRTASAESPLYRDAFEAVTGFATRFESAYEEQLSKMAATSDGQIPVSREDIWLVVDFEFATALGSLNPRRKDRRKPEGKPHA